MAKTVKFISRYASHIIYVNGVKVCFNRGEFNTSDPALIEGLKNSRCYGVDILSNEIKEQEPEAPKTLEAPDAPPQVSPNVAAQVAEANDVKKYQCKKCPFATDDLKEFRKHVTTAHRKG